MLENDVNISNSEEQSEPVLNSHYAPKKEDKFPLWKRAVLLGIGSFGLELIAIIVTFLTIGIPKSDRSGAINLITYSIVFVTLISVIFTDIPKRFLPAFKKWQPYVIGIGIGASIIIFDIVYITFVNLFYTAETSANESVIRNVIDVYPIASVFLFGIIGPLCEELTYRVGLFGLLKRVNRALAYVVTGLVFGFLHFSFTSSDIINELIFLPSYIVPGVALAVAYDLFDLPCAWTAHCVNNLWAIIGHIILSRM